MVVIVLSVFALLYTLAGASYADDSYTFTCERIMQAIPIDSGAFFYADLFNTGDQTDTYTITKHDNLPDGWFSAFCIDSLCLWDSGGVTLEPGGYSLIKPEIFPLQIPGDGEVIMRVRSHNNPDDIKELAFRIVTGYQTLLVNKDNVEETYRSYYEEALSSSGIEHNYWDGNFETFLDIDLQYFDNLLIFSGDNSSEIFTPEEITSLEGFLTSRGNLLMTGQGLASSPGGASLLEDMLGVRFVAMYDGQMEVDGVDGDPIGSGLHFTISGNGGADNQVEPDIIEPTGGVIAFEYPSGQGSGIRFEGDGYRSVFFAFGIEAVTESDIRAEIVSRSFDWFGQPTAIENDDFEIIPRQFVALSNYPNPFNAQTVISIEIEAPDIDLSAATIEIFDIVGRLVSQIEIGHRGDRAIWNGNDKGGSPVSSGVYFYRLSSPLHRAAFAKMLLLR